MFGLVPNNIELYKLALIHRSASLFLEDGTPINNERLEFLGDAVIETIVSDFLFIEYPEEKEGALSQLRSRIVSRSSLNRLAIEIGLDRHIIVQGNIPLLQKHIYGDALEAIFGAIYLDKGYDYANRLFINGILRKYVDWEDVAEQETDFKSRLIEWGQKSKRQINFETKPGAAYTSKLPQFQTQVYVDEQAVGKGVGGSKKESEQAAAHEAFLFFNLSVEEGHVSDGESERTESSRKE
ncbi:MAG TPA: ribonuclease III [Candidatus Alistipes merdigallinarum]|nr:ribonuclease III [Candidatus Alistipes merdigallinarum]